MSQEILVTFSALETATADIASSAASLNQKLDDLKTYIAPMVATWTGDAATHYQAKQRQWDTAAADLNTVLQAIGRAVDTAKGDFHSGEVHNTSLWT